MKKYQSLNVYRGLIFTGSLLVRLGDGHGHRFSIMNRIMFKVHHEENIDASFMIKKNNKETDQTGCAMES